MMHILASSPYINPVKDFPGEGSFGLMEEEGNPQVRGRKYCMSRTSFKYHQISLFFLRFAIVGVLVDKQAGVCHHCLLFMLLPVGLVRMLEWN